MKQIAWTSMLVLLPLTALAQRAGEFYSDDEFACGVGGSLPFGAGLFLLGGLAALWWFFSGPGGFLIERYPWLFALAVILGPMGVVFLTGWLF